MPPVSSLLPRLSSKQESILRLLSGESDLYALEMVYQLEELFGLQTAGATMKHRIVPVSRATIYVTLRRMAAKGYVQSTVAVRRGSEATRLRRYRATREGLRVLRGWDRARLAFGRA